MKPLGNQRGMALIILIAIIAVAGILMGATTYLMGTAARHAQSRIDQTRAYYMAQAGLMAAIQDWRDSNNNLVQRVYSATSATFSGNQVYKNGFRSSPHRIIQSNFACFRQFSGRWATVGANRRLRAWQIRNIYDDPTNTSPIINDVTIQGVKISWDSTVSPSPTLRQISLAGGALVPVGSYASGTTFVIPLLTPRTLSPGDPSSNANAWIGNNNFFEWTGNGPDVQAIHNVRVQWFFSDNTSSREISYWGNGVAQAGTPPTENIFSITATGDVDNGGGNRASTTIHSTISCPTSGGTRMEIIEWNKLDANIV